MRNEHFADGAAEKFREATPARPEDYGIQHVPHADVPHGVMMHHAFLGVDNDKHGEEWSHAPVETIPATATIKTAQDSVGVEHVAKYAARLRGGKGPADFRDKGASDEDQNDGRPRLLRLHGDLWHVDGLHRMAAARGAGRDFKARVYDVDKVARPSYGAAPTEHWGLVDHLSEDHVHDNTFVDEDTDWEPHEVKSYHDELHSSGAADHTH